MIPLLESVSSWRSVPLRRSCRRRSFLVRRHCPPKWETRDNNETAALNLGLSTVNAIGNGIRESRQNEMIYQERAELGAAREREAEMAARIRQLEMMQMQQAGGGGQQAAAQPQIIIAQPPVMQVAPSQQ
jgi:hypothetical protein